LRYGALKRRRERLGAVKLGEGSRHERWERRVGSSVYRVMIPRHDSQEASRRILHRILRDLGLTEEIYREPDLAAAAHGEGAMRIIQVERRDGTSSTPAVWTPLQRRRRLLGGVSSSESRSLTRASDTTWSPSSRRMMATPCAARPWREMPETAMRITMPSALMAITS